MRAPACLTVEMQLEPVQMADRLEDPRAMTTHHSDRVFSGSVPVFYETNLVPLIFEPYARDLTLRVASEYS